MLDVVGLNAWYGQSQALFGVALRVEKGETLALVGTNGAGKSTTVGSIAGSVHSSGRIVFNGQPIDGLRQFERARLGIRVVPENRGLFWGMTVAENLELGLSGGIRRKGRVGEMLELFPLLRERVRSQASDLSGGEQQMLAIARALVARPDFLMLDEPSLGLAPVMIDLVYQQLVTLKNEGLTMLLVEQSIHRAATLADRLCLVRAGEIVTSVAPKDEEMLIRLEQEALGEGKGHGEQDDAE